MNHTLGDTLVAELNKRHAVVREMGNLSIGPNNDWVVPAGLDERRFCVIDVNETRARDRAYFGAVVAQMSQGGSEAMLHDLMQLNLSDFDIAEVPQTSAPH